MKQVQNLDWHNGESHTIDSPAPVVEAEEGERLVLHSTLVGYFNEARSSGLLSPGASRRPASSMSTRSDVVTKKEHELAGGIEDWEDISGNDVDRYGFISIRTVSSRPGTPESRPPQRTSTLLQLASASPRPNAYLWPKPFELFCVQESKKSERERYRPNP